MASGEARDTVQQTTTPGHLEADRQPAVPMWRTTDDESPTLDSSRPKPTPRTRYQT